MSETPGIYNAGKAGDRANQEAIALFRDGLQNVLGRLQAEVAKNDIIAQLLRDNEELNARLAERTQDHLKASERDVAEIQRLRVENDALKRRLADLEAEHAWRPIEEAPKDGTKFLGVSEDGYMAVWFSDCDWKDWWSNDDLAFDSPTHFRPLPKPPQSTP